MSAFDRNFHDAEFVARYVEVGPAAFLPGHAGMLRMAGLLIAERAPRDARILVVGAGGGLDTLALAKMQPGWSFTGVDPAGAMLDLARDVLGDELCARVEFVEGVAADAPAGPFDAATCVLVLGLIPDDGSKLATLTDIRRRLKPRAPFILVDQCLDRTAPDFQLRLDRYAAYARLSGVDGETVASARAQLAANSSVTTARRDEALLAEAGFSGVEVFYVGMAWRGWVAYA